MKPFEAWLPVYPGDWIRDTMHLDATCNGAYWFLILAHWGKPGLPADDKSLRAICRVAESQWDEVKTCLKQFFSEKDGLWVNKRCCEEYEKARGVYQKQCNRTRKATDARMEFRPRATPSPTVTLTADSTPEWEHVSKWLESAREMGADYTEQEARAALLALKANGFMWGKNPVADWRAAIESKIQSARNFKPDSSKTPRKRQLI